MPWSNQTGGGQNNGSGNGGEGPWGQSPGGPRRPGGGGQQPPDLEEILKRGQERLKNVMPGGGGTRFGGGASFWGLVVVAGLAAWALASAYQVDADELGVETLFGKPKDEISTAGLHFAFWPVEKVEKIKIVENKVNIGSTSNSRSKQGLMLSGDQNIVDVAFTVLYSVADPKKFLFNVKDAQGMVAQVSESAMREIVGRRPAQDIFRDDREGIAQSVLKIVQSTLDDYGAGLSIRGVNIEDAAPPAEVAQAYDEVQRAEQNEDQVQEEANKYRNNVLGEARGEGAQIREDAAAYKNRVVEESKGEASVFSRSIINM